MRGTGGIEESLGPDVAIEQAGSARTDEGTSGCG